MIANPLKLKLIFEMTWLFKKHQSFAVNFPTSEFSVSHQYHIEEKKFNWEKRFFLISLIQSCKKEENLKFLLEITFKDF